VLVFKVAGLSVVTNKEERFAAVNYRKVAYMALYFLTLSVSFLVAQLKLGVWITSYHQLSLTCVELIIYKNVF